MQHLQQTTLPGTLEVNRSRLQWVRRVVDLLGEIEAVVRLASKTARSMSTERDTGGQVILRSFADLVVARTRHRRSPEMVLVLTNSCTLLGIRQVG